MQVDSRGTFWIGTSKGLLIYDQKNNSIRKFNFKDPEVPESSQYIHDIIEIEEDGKTFKAKRNIVLVDDNIEMLKYLKMELKDSFNLEAFDNAKDAWASITANLPDAIVTDIIMSSEHEGLEFCDKIKHNPGTQHIPVIILSSKNDEESILKCTDCGADKYLLKPFIKKIVTFVSLTTSEAPIPVIICTEWALQCFD